MLRDIKKNPKTTSSLINHQRRIHNRFNKEEKEQSNALITSFFKYDEKDLQKLHHAVLEYIIRDLRPLSTINGDGFIYLLRVLNPRYKLPSYKTLVKLLKDKYITVQNEV